MQTSAVQNMPTNLNNDYSSDPIYKMRQSKDPAEDIPLDMDRVNSRNSRNMSRTTDQYVSPNPIE
jgi:hypothetical protein